MSLPLSFPDHLSDLVIFDCDDLLFDWTSPNWKRLIELGYPVDPAGPSTFGMQDWTGVKSKAEFDALILDFNASPAFARLPPRPGAVDLVRDLLETGHRLHVVSSCSTDPAVVRSRCENLHADFGEGAFEEITCIPLYASKLPELARRPPALFFDDRLSNVIDGISVGHYGIVVRTGQNSADKPAALSQGIPWLEDLSGFRPEISRLPHVVRRAEMLLAP